MTLNAINTKTIEMKQSNYYSNYENMTYANEKKIFEFYEYLNKQEYHFTSKDDVCTPMECVKQMVEYIPNEFWSRKNINILDPCAGNGNFPAYLKFKTNLDNVWLNELNETRYNNSKTILAPKNILNLDFFELAKTTDHRWDLIISNPPYSGGRNKNTSISNKFIEESIDLLNKEGYLCFVTPNNWMTFNNDNKTLKKLLMNGSFLIIDNNVKKYFPQIGSSFTIFVWQKGVYNNKTYVVNNYLIKDTKKDIFIPNNIPFIPLYISQNIINILPKAISQDRNRFDYRCDLHNYTRNNCLRDKKDKEFIYETIHTARKTRYANIKQDIYDQWTIIVPLSTYYIPYIRRHVNVTQSVGYISFETEREAVTYLEKIKRPIFKVLVHLTRYGNFNNIKILRHFKFDEDLNFTEEEKEEITKLNKLIKY